MRTLAIQAANGNYNQEDRQALNAEYQQLKQHLSTVAQDSNFAGKSLLNGQFNETLQVGADAMQTIDLQLPKFDITHIGTDATKQAAIQTPNYEIGAINIFDTMNVTYIFNELGIYPDKLPERSDVDEWHGDSPVITATTSTGTEAVVMTGAYNSTHDIAQAVTAANLGIRASATTYTPISFRETPRAPHEKVPYDEPVILNFDLVGGGGTVPISASFTDFQDGAQVQAMADQINQHTATTGIRAVAFEEFHFLHGSNHGVYLIDDDGHNIGFANIDVDNAGENSLELRVYAGRAFTPNFVGAAGRTTEFYRYLKTPVQTTEINHKNILTTGTISYFDTETGEPIPVSDWGKDRPRELFNNTYTTTYEEVPEIAVSDTDILSQDSAQQAISVLDGALGQINEGR
ncbi:hypothetical protein L1077_27120, partial [Pseudoalteromonas luteoviolacea]|uniref:flagellin N-terminal helical domain-containing protein n=1 Tax=Pseudoalteromonas luteoviolacea TaxID=43657 RepID=UPI003F7F17A0|nr:hypothetical protein [Pseudoalteromonas luteoviolacea]